MYTITGKVTSTVRAKTRGNPTFFVTLETPAGETIRLRTESNTSISYVIGNPEYRGEWHVFNLTKAGRIRSAKMTEENR